MVEEAVVDVSPGADLGWWGPLEHDALTLVQKVLLATDGTVTRILEAFAGETMQLVKLSQEAVALSSADPGMDGAEGEEVISRRILLRGAQSGCNFLYAESLILPHRLHPRLRSGLLHSDAPIGRLLSEHRIETARELIRWGVEPADSCASYFGIDPRETLVSRTYRVISQRQPIMLISEKFYGVAAQTRMNRRGESGRGPGSGRRPHVDNPRAMLETSGS